MEARLPPPIYTRLSLFLNAADFDEQAQRSAPFSLRPHPTTFPTPFKRNDGHFVRLTLIYILLFFPSTLPMSIHIISHMSGSPIYTIIFPHSSSWPALIA